ncbi:hypothetical protein EVAR_99183_1 [Eumeta japonica]|uniref:Uncharacterized protein n=1 Tax=Eumeta variegata TaxID=151549 RepID=A0A4C1YU27_EUMVA|nr:hypothetical protein EVAR_99183_1 [Eumeta japonica]
MTAKRVPRMLTSQREKTRVILFTVFGAIKGKSICSHIYKISGKITVTVRFRIVTEGCDVVKRRERLAKSKLLSDNASGHFLLLLHVTACVFKIMDRAPYSPDLFPWN